MPIYLDYEEYQNGQLVRRDVGAIDATSQNVEADLRAKARAALTANQAFLALASPTNAQVLAQVQRLTRETSALIRLMIGADLLVENTDT